MTPIQALTGQTPDISIILPFKFYKQVYFATADKLSYNTKVNFPVDASEDKGRFVGFGENVGDAMTFKILTDKTKRVIYRSLVRLALRNDVNVRIESTYGEILAKSNDEMVGTTVHNDNLSLQQDAD